jgi:cysteinyl-tRNA synthetase
MWMHNGMVNSNKEKMSKSLGNFFVLRDLYKHFDPMVIRYYFLTHHYRMPIEFSFEALSIAQKSYERLIRLCDGSLSTEALPCPPKLLAEDGAKVDDIDGSEYRSALIDRMMDFLQDDLNTPGLLGVIFENIADIARDKDELAAVKNILINVLGLTLQSLPVQKIELTPEIEALIDARNKARREKNWARADELRDQLEKLGIDVRDSKI